MLTRKFRRRIHNELRRESHNEWVGVGKVFSLNWSDFVNFKTEYDIAWITREENLLICTGATSWKKTTTTDPDSAYTMFSNRLRKLYVSCFLCKSISASRKIRKTWVTKKLVGKTLYKNALYKQIYIYKYI